MIAFAALAAVVAAAAADKPLIGFSDASASAQRALEARYDGKLDAAALGPWMDRLAARPHHVGSEHGRKNVEFLAEQFRSWGYDTRIEEFGVLFPTPKVRLLEMTAPTRFRASLAEPALPEDRTSSQQAEQLPTYNAYSIDGDVTGELVYVNFGVPADYDELDRRGIDVKGKVVLARYYGSWRGIKPKVAAEHGAVGCIIFSDPHEDGFFNGDTYPQGGWRSGQGAQRGSVADMPLYPGDPLTPGVGATAEAKRGPVREAATLTKIPVLPVSYADALPLLRALGGPVAPPSWRGSAPVPYHIGPGPARVHLKLEFDWSLHPARNVIATLRGAELPDQWIVRGNHHDAWVNGATDPVSGMVAMMAEAKAVGELAREGKAPRRTVVYAAWDAEEPGLLGSTEWAEHHGDELRAKAAVYVNSDSNSRGILGMGGSHSLERLMSQVARDVADPVLNVSVGQRLRAQAIVSASADERADAWDRPDLRLDALGSGSDYSPFLQHLGIASLNLGYGGEDAYGQYHSIYDSIDHYRRFQDEGFAYGIVQARTTGRTVLRLANADVLPLEFTNVADTIGRYVKELEALADSRRKDVAESNRRAHERIDLLAADARFRYQPRAVEAEVPHFNFAPLRNAVSRLERAARDYERALKETAGTLEARRRAELDGILLGTERAFTRPEGLPRRPWYKHQIYAPGWYTGYGVKTIPAVREAIEQRTFEEVEPAVRTAAQAVEAYAAQVERAAALVSAK